MYVCTAGVRATMEYEWTMVPYILVITIVLDRVAPSFTAALGIIVFSGILMKHISMINETKPRPVSTQHVLGEMAERGRERMRPQEGEAEGREPVQKQQAGEEEEDDDEVGIQQQDQEVEAQEEERLHAQQEKEEEERIRNFFKQQAQQREAQERERLRKQQQEAEDSRMQEQEQEQEQEAEEEERLYAQKEKEEEERIRSFFKQQEQRREAEERERLHKQQQQQKQAADIRLETRTTQQREKVRICPCPTNSITWFSLVDFHLLLYRLRCTLLHL
jgi:hypothetical protein